MCAFGASSACSARSFRHAGHYQLSNCPSETQSNPIFFCWQRDVQATASFSMKFSTLNGDEGHAVRAHHQLYRSVTYCAPSQSHSSEVHASYQIFSTKSTIAFRLLTGAVLSFFFFNFFHFFSLLCHRRRCCFENDFFPKKENRKRSPTIFLLDARHSFDSCYAQFDLIIAMPRRRQ